MRQSHGGEWKALAVIAGLGALAVALVALIPQSDTETTEADTATVTTTVQFAPQRVSFYSEDFPAELGNTLDSSLYTQVILTESTNEPDTGVLELYLRNSAWKNPGAIAAQVGAVSEQFNQAGADNATFISNSHAGPRIFIHEDYAATPDTETLDTQTLTQLLELAANHNAKSFGLYGHTSVTFHNTEYRDRFIRDFQQQFPSGIGSEVFAGMELERAQSLQNLIPVCSEDELCSNYDIGPRGSKKHSTEAGKHVQACYSNLEPYDATMFKHGAR